VLAHIEAGQVEEEGGLTSVGFSSDDDYVLGVGVDKLVETERIFERERRYIGGPNINVGAVLLDPAECSLGDSFEYSFLAEAVQNYPAICLVVGM
jgi:quinolinate synthase